MLILTRKNEQGIWVGSVHIKFTCTGRVRVMIDAPPDVRILRDELERKESNRKDGGECGGTTSTDL